MARTRRLKLRIRCRASLALLLAFLSSAVGAAVAESPLRIAVTEIQAPLVTNSVLFLAQSEGFFKHAGVEVELVQVQQTPSAVAALRAGEVDMADISTEAALRLAVQGNTGFKAILAPGGSLPFLVAARDDIVSVADLEGRSFGIGRVGSLDHSLTLAVLAAHGAKLQDLEFVGLGQPSIRARALAAGTIDATAISVGTWLSMPSHQGLHVLVAPEDFVSAAPVIAKVIVVPREVLQDRPADVQAVVRALVLASRHYAAHPDQWVDAMARQRPDIGRAELEQLAGMLGSSWSANGGMNAERLRRTQAFLLAGIDPAGAAPKLSDWVSFEPVETVLDEEGVVDGLDAPGR